MESTVWLTVCQVSFLGEMFVDMQGLGSETFTYFVFMGVSLHSYIIWLLLAGMALWEILRSAKLKGAHSGKAPPTKPLK
jgi:hypothetical protein